MSKEGGKAKHGKQNNKVKGENDCNRKERLVAPKKEGTRGHWDVVPCNYDANESYRAATSTGQRKATSKRNERKNAIKRA